MARIKSTISGVEKRIDAVIEPYKQVKELLETIPGVGSDTAIEIIAEIITDMDNFPDHNHLAS